MRGNRAWARDSRVERGLRAHFSQIEVKKEEEKMRGLPYIQYMPGVKGAGVSVMLMFTFLSSKAPECVS